MYEKSLKIYQIIYYLKEFWLGCMISILFLKYIGLVDSEIAIFHLIMGILIFLFEIPTGSFADKYGYRTSIILSFLFLALAFLSFLIATLYGKLIILLLTSLFFSLSHSFHSGASNSYVYKIFKHNNKESEYINFQSVLSKNLMIIEGSAILIGSYLYSINEILPYLIQFILVFIALILSFKLENEPKHINEGITNSIKLGFKEFLSNKLYISVVVFLILFTIPYEYFHNVINQSIFVEVGFSVKEIGVIGFISYIFSSFLILSFPYLWKKLGEKRIYLLLPSIILFLFLLLIFIQSKSYILFLTIMVYFIFKINDILIDYSMQRRVSDEIRATMLSIISMFASLPIRILFVIIALHTLDFTYIKAFYTIGIFFSLLSLIYVYFILKKLIHLNGIK